MVRTITIFLIKQFVIVAVFTEESLIIIMLQ